MVVEERDFNNVTLDRMRMHISGKGTQYNQEGARNFTIVFHPEDDIDGETMDDLIARNWPIRVVDRGDGNVTGYLKVIINYAQPVTFEMYLRKPAFENGKRITAVDANGVEHPLYHTKEVALDQEESKQIDGLSISDVDVTLTLSTYNSKGFGSGYCVYLKDMSFAKDVSHFAGKYNKCDVAEIRPDLAGKFDTPLPFGLD
jgi:hypothetical protein